MVDLLHEQIWWGVVRREIARRSELARFDCYACRGARRSGPATRYARPPAPILNYGGLKITRPMQVTAIARERERFPATLCLNLKNAQVHGPLKRSLND